MVCETGEVRLEGRRAYAERMISVSFAWFAFILLAQVLRPHLSSETSFIIREVGFLSAVVAVLDALIIRLSAAGLPHAEVVAVVYGGAILFGCDQLGGSSQNGLMLSPWLFLLLSVVPLVPKNKSNGRDMFKLNITKTKRIAGNSILCFASAVAVAATLHGRAPILTEFPAAIAVIWFGWHAWSATRQRATVIKLAPVGGPDPNV
jgi:hypothetical protein